VLGPVYRLGYPHLSRHRPTGGGEGRGPSITLKTTLIAQAENKPWRAELRKYLPAYRSKQGLKCFSLREL